MANNKKTTIGWIAAVWTSVNVQLLDGISELIYGGLSLPSCQYSPKMAEKLGIFNNLFQKCHINRFQLSHILVT